MPDTLEDEPLGISPAVVEMASRMLPGDSRTRLAALVSAKTARPETDATDQCLLAHYILTGSAMFPDQEEQYRLEVRTMSSPPEYPYETGDALVLGPEIFTNTKDGPAENTVICWQGMNFVPQQSAENPSVAELMADVPPAPTEGRGWKGIAPT